MIIGIPNGCKQKNKLYEKYSKKFHMKLKLMQKKGTHLKSRAILEFCSKKKKTKNYMDVLTSECLRKKHPCNH